MKTTLLWLRFVFSALLFLLPGRAALAQTVPQFAVQLNGTTGYVSTTMQFANPRTYTITIWFNTTTVYGGRLLGFGSSETGASTNYDRHLYMDVNGHILFGNYNGNFQVISNKVACNDGHWHQAAGTFSSTTGMSLYIDGVLAAANSSFNQAETYNGWWRMGYDTLGGWPNAPASYYFAGTIGEVQIWNTALTSNQIASNLHLPLTGEESGLVSYWIFDYGDGTQEPDYSDNGNMANFQGGAAWVASTEPIGVPAAQNLPVSDIGTNVVTVNGSILPNFQQTGAWFEYGLTTNYGFTNPVIAIGPNNANAVPVSQNIGGLQTSTVYHCQLMATNSAGTNGGGDFTFATAVPTPTVITLAATNITGTSLTLKGSVNPNGVAATAWFEWGATTSYGNATTPAEIGSGTNAEPVSATISGMQGAEVFHYHVVAATSYGRFIGADQIMELPLIGLYGNNPLTNDFGVPFEEPGYLLAPTTPLALAAGENFGLALKGDGALVGWGDQAYGQTSIPASLSNVVAVAAGDYFAVALQNNGMVMAWGNNNYGQTNVPAGLSNVVAVAAGNYFALALQSNGTITAWGDNSRGETNVPAGLSNFVAIAAGNYFALALQSDGNIVLWGDNRFGQLNAPAGLSNVAAIAAGGDFSLALLNDSTVTGWGSDEDSEDTLPSGLTNVVAIAVGSYFCMALQNNGTIIGWGSDPSLGSIPVGWDIAENARAIVGGSKFAPSGFIPEIQSQTLVAISAGFDFSLGFDGDGTVISGGNSTDGDLNIPSGLDVPSYPITVTGSVNVNVPGVYTLTYSASNFLGAVDTVTRTVVVTPPPPPAGFTITNIAKGQFALQFTGNTNAGYTVLSSTNIAMPLPKWTVLGSATPLSNNLFQFTDSSATNIPARFYMLRSP